MSIKATLNKAVKKAFSSVGDLAVSATLGNKTVTSYSFSSGQVSSSISAIPVKAIITSTSSSSRGGSKLIGIIESGVTVDVYDTLLVKGILYNITGSTDNGYTIELNLVKEAI